ncbi:GNAT family N-acetyltransferase [Sphaerisporangium sp. B11E5]|uniref:GNAT family N-acetyltransferase n=1 Tax=Sphaerisporangium sp. B11E5 TaxID=3153563 RepID=UPI00325EAD29
MTSQPSPRFSPRIRTLDKSEWPDWMEVFQEAFNQEFPPERNARFEAVMEFDRTLGAFDGDRLVGTTVGSSFSMTVPGGPRPVCGVTGVAVLPSHRRRGVLSSLMRRQLADLHENGEALAALYASEAGIYGRYGYGRGVDNLFFRIPRHGARLAPHAPSDPALRVRVEKPATVREELEKVFEAVRPTRPGQYARNHERWNVLLADDETARRGNGPLRCVIAEDDAGVRGYALFRVKSQFTDHDVPDGEVMLMELFAVDPAAYALVWSQVLDRDLCSSVYAWNRPADDPVIHLLAEPRHLNAGWLDEMWIRVVDVERAMPERAYSAAADVVIEVEDPVCPWNEGRWRLSCDREGATWSRTTDPADVSLPVSVLGAAYLGGRPLGTYHSAGVADEHRRGALRELSAAMLWDIAPWGGLVF